MGRSAQKRSAEIGAQMPKPAHIATMAVVALVVVIAYEKFSKKSA